MTSAIEAVIQSHDLDLLKALMARGLDVRSTKLCPAHTAAQEALKPGGDLMLDFLLQNGASLSCLYIPPMLACLASGLSMENYPSDQAIRVAEILVKHGVPIRQRDAQGKTIFDLLNEPGVYRHPHAALLRAALAQLELRRR
jgi:hypothetical protein